MHEEEVFKEVKMDSGIKQIPVRSPYWSFLSHTMLDWKNRDDTGKKSQDELPKHQPQPTSATHLSEGDNTDEIRSNEQKGPAPLLKQYYGINKLHSAFEGGHRLLRRDKNIAIAFTYGFKLGPLNSLDIHNYKE